MSHGGAGLWDVESGEMIPGECNQAQPSEQGRVVIIRDDRRAFAMKMNDRETRVFDFASGKPLSPVLKAGFSERHPPRAMFSPAGTAFLVMDATDRTRVFSLPGGELRRTLVPPSPAPKEPSDNCIQAVFTADSKSCFLISASGVAQRYDGKTWKPSGPLMEHPHWNGYTFGLAASADGRWIATTDSPGENGPRSYLQLWDGLSGKKHGPSMEDYNGWSVVFSGGLLFATPGRGEGRVMDPATGRQIFSIPRHDDVEGPSISLSPDGRSLLSFGYDGLLLLQDTLTGERKGMALQPRPDVVRWAQDSSCVYSLNNSFNGADRRHSFSIVKLTAPPLEVRGEVHMPASAGWMDLSPDGKKLLVCHGKSGHGEMLIYDTDSMTPSKTAD